MILDGVTPHARRSTMRLSVSRRIGNRASYPLEEV